MGKPREIRIPLVASVDKPPTCSKEEWCEKEAGEESSIAEQVRVKYFLVVYNPPQARDTILSKKYVIDESITIKVIIETHVEHL